MPVAYFFVAIAILVLGVTAKLFLESRVKSSYGENTPLLRLIGVGMDAVLVGALIVAYISMKPGT